MFLGQGERKWLSVANYSSKLSFSPSSVAWTDLNNDSRMDFVLSYIDTNSIAVFPGLDQVSFRTEEAMRLDTSCNLFSVSVIDFNDDNQLDIVT